MKDKKQKDSLAETHQKGIKKRANPQRISPFFVYGDD
jgi:hypothetical protein